MQCIADGGFRSHAFDPDEISERQMEVLGLPFCTCPTTTVASTGDCRVEVSWLHQAPLQHLGCTGSFS